MVKRIEGGGRPGSNEGPIDLYKIYESLNNFFTNQMTNIKKLITGEEGYWEILGEDQKEDLRTLIEYSDSGVIQPHILDGLTPEEEKQIRRVVIKNKQPENLQELKAFGRGLEKIANKIKARSEETKPKWGN